MFDSLYLPSNVSRRLMKIILNATNLKQGGALQITRSILEHYQQISENEYHVFLSPQLSRMINTSGFPENFQFYLFDANPTDSIYLSLTFFTRFSKLEQEIKPDFVLTVFGPALWKPKSPHLMGFANGLYLYDESRFIQEIWLNNLFRRIRYYARRYLLLKRIKTEADLLWTETQFSKDRLSKELRFPPEKIFVVSNTAGKQYIPSESPANSKTFKFLYLSADYPHKNLDIFNQLLPLLKRRNIDCSFYLTLPAKVFERRFPNYQNDKMLINLGPLPPEKCPDAYNHCDALFFPSFIETFSANYPESMAMNKPIITSDLDFAHSICGDAALYFDPFDPHSIAATIQQLIDNPMLRKELVAKGKERLKNFDTAAERAEKLLKIMKDYLNRKL
jgi:glycosyltransferase involved in cell wall biosynthesis